MPRTGLILVATTLVAVGCASGSTTTADAPTTTRDSGAPVTTAPGPPLTSAPSTSAGSGQSSSVPSTTGDSSTTQPAESPKTPTGPFLSSHELSLGATRPTTAQSVCHTTPGATCQITFTKGETVEKLPAQTTDAQGVTSWVWTPAEIGLTVGQWEVEITAESGTAGAGTNDVQGLRVVP